jgi:hypothetical protein
MPKLQCDYTDFCSQIDEQTNLCTDVTQLSPIQQKAIAETALLRSFDFLQGFFLCMATKLVSGAKYLDGTKPIVLTPARSRNAAIINMKTVGRPKPRKDLRWSKVSDIKDNCKFVIPTTEHFLTTLAFHTILIDEMRKIRNRIAHNNRDSRMKYQTVVMRYYGAAQKQIAPGTLLLSDRFAPRLIDQYLARSKVLVKQMVKG